MRSDSDTTPRSDLAVPRWLAWVWSGWLAATILLAGTRFHPLPVGRVSLAMIVLGFAIFTVGRRGRLDESDQPAGAGVYAAAYWGGYGLMLAAAVLTTVVAVREWVA